MEEDAGPVYFVFSVLQSNIAFDVSVLFFTAEGKAISKSPNHCIFQVGCPCTLENTVLSCVHIEHTTSQTLQS